MNRRRHTRVVRRISRQRGERRDRVRTIIHNFSFDASSLSIMENVPWLAIYCLVGFVVATTLVGGGSLAMLLGVLFWPLVAVFWLLSGVLKIIVAVAAIVFAVWIGSKIIDAID